MHFFFLSDLDGKLYDAYVAYPQHCAVGFSEKVETFALHTLPQVLEKACGYKLFIAGRDCLPGQGKSPTWGRQHCSRTWRRFAGDRCLWLQSYNAKL